MPKIVQITEAYTDALSLVALGDNGRAYKYDGTDKSWTILPELPEDEEKRARDERHFNGLEWAKRELQKQESMKTLLRMGYCDNCANQRSGQCLYCEATETNPKPTQFIPIELTELQIKEHAAVTMGVK